MCTFFAVDALCYLIANVSHGEQTLIVLFLQALSVAALIQRLVGTLPPNKFIQEKVFFLYFFAAILLALIVKMYTFTKIKAKVLLGFEKE
jgi:hydrogenase-4 membrane subunit HyfE